MRRSPESGGGTLSDPRGGLAGACVEGLPAARAYANIAPDSAHALHMPSHIFRQLGLWQEDIDSNLASEKAAAMTTEMKMGDANYQFHAMEFLNYAYLQSGQEEKAGPSWTK